MPRLLLLPPLLLLSITCLAAGEIDFERQIRPLLIQHCVDCHGPDEQNGGLRLDRGGQLDHEADSGKRAVVPGQPEHSELLVRVTSTSEDDQMPPEGERLSAQQIDVLRRWIAAGAKWPMGATDLPATDDTLESHHWSFQPIHSAAPPSVRASDWPRGDLDRFLQSKRESAGLTVAEDAEPLVFVRRATYALTGLPPTIEQINAFSDHVQRSGMPAAISELVDDLLSRPSYGERWGRHWMDWVRYADTAGDNSDYPIPQAYLYRNYIVDSLNQDLPYDRFLTEQLAGDLLPADSLAQRNRQTIATGYLAMARRFGSLVERYPWHLTIEDTIDNVGRTMMGLTIACARCHDHKFDPISARDYYAMYGIFASTRYPFPGLELFQAQRDFVSLLDAAETQAALGKSQPETEKLVAELNQQLQRCDEQSLENARREKGSSVEQQRRMRNDLDKMLLKARRAGEQLAKHLKTLPEIPTAYAVAESTPVDARIQIKGEPTRPGAAVPRGFPEILGGYQLDPALGQTNSGRLQLAQWITHPDNPLTARVIVNRVWQRHFGTGLVSSTSDFGLRGQPPTHPELLDALAVDFVNHGWSLKHLHRRIMNSHVYALSSRDVPGNLTTDPDNHLYWRFNRQRMDAESLRDTLLMVADHLDCTPQTQPYPFPPRDKWTFTQHHPFKDDYQSNKRSVYLMTKRLTAKTYFQTFDGPDPNVCTSDRDQSVTALQALYFVNDDFLHQQADRFATRVLNHSAEMDERIRFAFESILCRPPSEQETQMIREHLNSVTQHLAPADDGQHQTWSSVTRSLFRLNEFLYLD
ncbi:PSD1 and planctomycete cytochrome C domain-containing protein [Stieleria sp. TO1_6]|uniref:PSD1 and planctomycete cytochrome C domain-containing protein n=1 Tax=Stieleria tagensis TaxID=2956795 RepID=UPI00209B33A6|nr:PSD1 and planctomycete cytochrome C domain-containing protein [Stieleria tagensis]MCO8123240.1 PSD1 and planctomycete cytochrome C domain-containing protein [Stieleria tagensis]